MSTNVDCDTYHYTTSYRVYSIVNTFEPSEAHCRFGYYPSSLSLTVGGELHKAQLLLAFAAEEAYRNDDLIQ